MSHAASLHAHQPASRAGAATLSVLLAWLALVVALGAIEAFVAPPGAPPLPLLAAVAGPVMAFLIAYRVSPAVREFAQAADLRFLTATQAWRFGGFAFLALYAYGVLPAFFAWPAGLGDMAIAATVPWMLAGLVREPGFATSRRFIAWNVLGIVDLVVAVSVGAVVPLLFPGVAGAEAMGAMARLPLVLIPGFFVPGYLIVHVIALAQAGGAADFVDVMAGAQHRPVARAAVPARASCVCAALLSQVARRIRRGFHRTDGAGTGRQHDFSSGAARRAAPSAARR